MQETKVQDLFGLAKWFLGKEWPSSLGTALFRTPQGGGDQKSEHQRHDYRD
jgi:hypothetical protein